MRLPISCSMCGDARVVEAYCVTCSGGTYTLTDLDEAKAEAGKLRDILRDVWNQFAAEKPDGTKWHGGLSTLKDVESALQLVKKEGE